MGAEVAQKQLGVGLDDFEFGLLQQNAQDFLAYRRIFGDFLEKWVVHDVKTGDESIFFIEDFHKGNILSWVGIDRKGKVGCGLERPFLSKAIVQ